MLLSVVAGTLNLGASLSALNTLMEGLNTFYHVLHHRVESTQVWEVIFLFGQFFYRILDGETNWRETSLFFLVLRTRHLDELPFRVKEEMKEAFFRKLVTNLVVC